MPSLKSSIIGALGAIFLIISAGCREYMSAAADDIPVFVPAPPDYADDTMWTVMKNDTDLTGADVFYIPSTWEYDWQTPDGLICHYAEPSKEEHRAHMRIEMDGVAEYMAVGNNFYSPYYRHITLDSWATLNEDTIARRYGDVSFIDVKNAFDDFIARKNGGRPFILAGFSQGGKSVVELLKTLAPDTRERMVAAYVMGYKVTPEDVAGHPYITAATGATDTGVVICYNSVSDMKYVKPVVSAPNVMCINPVNWRTDATPALLADTVTVTLDPEAKVLVLDGFDGSYLPNILGILNVGDYHGAEPWIYSECLGENMRARIAAFRQKSAAHTPRNSHMK